jgi:hypothetical protein
MQIYQQHLLEMAIKKMANPNYGLFSTGIKIPVESNLYFV